MEIGGFVIASDGRAAVVRLGRGLEEPEHSGVLVCTPVPGGGGDGLLSKLCCFLPWVPSQQTVRAGPQGRGSCRKDVAV